MTQVAPHEPQSSELPVPAMRLVWQNPKPAFMITTDPVLLLECRSRRHAYHVLRLLDSGYVRERRRGDRMIFEVYQGRKPAPLKLIGGYEQTLKAA